MAEEIIKLVANEPFSSDNHQVVVVTDTEGKPWVFLFHSDCGEDIAITPTGDRVYTYTHDGSAPVGVPEVLWFTMLDLIDA